MAELTADRPTLERTSLVDLIGHTPLVRLHAVRTSKPGVEIYAKLEMQNPGGSVKDRAALAMMLEGERSGALGGGRILLDATSGNTGIAYAMLGAARGHRVRLCVPANVSPERTRLLRVYGADLVLTDPMEGSDGAIRQVRAIYARDPQRYFYPDQYSNPANWTRALQHAPASRSFEQTSGRVTHFVAGLGTSGTFVGTGRRLKQDRPGVTLVSVQPDSPLHGLEGLKHMESAIVPAIFDADLADIDARIDTDEAHALVRRLAREEGLFVGPSSGAALAAGLHVADDLNAGVIVAIFPGWRRSLPVGLAVGWRQATARAPPTREPVASAHRRAANSSPFAGTRRASIRTNAAARCSGPTRRPASPRRTCSTTRSRTRSAGGFSSGLTNIGARRNARPKPACRSSASITRIRIIRPSRPSSTSTMRGRT